jgi:choline monooxygenase
MEYVLDANWKLLCENGFECYHCPTNHPELAAMRDVRPDFWFELHENFTVHGLPSEPSETVPGRSYGKRALLSHLWPNLFPVVRDGGYVTAFQALPLDVERSIFRREFWFSPDVDGDARQDLIDINAVTDRQDVDLLAWVQRGQRSRYYDRGRLLLPNTEPGVHYFQRHVHRALTLDGA